MDKGFATTQEWSRFLCDAALGGPCEYFGCSLHELLDDPDRWDFAVGCLREAAEVVKRYGVNLPFANPEIYVSEFAQDCEGDTTLVTSVAAHLVELAKEVNLQTPFNSKIVG